MSGNQPGPGNQSNPGNQPWLQEARHQFGDPGSGRRGFPGEQGPVMQEPVSDTAFGPFDTRDIVVLISVLLIFLGSLLPLTITRLRVENLWNTEGLFFLGVGILLPILLGILTLLRRLRHREVRIGSFTLNQFGSVVAALAFAYYFLNVVTDFGWAYSVALVGSMGLMLATVCAPWAPGLFPDAAGKQAVVPPQGPEARWGSPYGTTSPSSAASQLPQSAPPQNAAHAYAMRGAEIDHGAESDAARSEQAAGHVDTVASTYAEPFSPVPDAEIQDPAEPEISDWRGEAPAGTSPEDELAAQNEPVAEGSPEQSGPTTETAAPGESLTATVDPAEDRNAYRAFWFAVDTPRSAVDENTGLVRYLIEPGAWFLALEDRGHEFLVQSHDGVVAVLRDLRNIERAPEEG